MNRLNLILCALYAVALISCTQSNTENTVETITFDIGKSGDAFPKVKSTTLELETTKNSLLSDISQIKFHKNYIYILDMYQDNSAIFVFDTIGNFVRCFAKYGHGPGEVLSPSSFAIENDQFIIFDDTKLQLLFYDLAENKYLYSKDAPRGKSECIFTTEGTIIWHNDGGIDYYYTLTDSSNFKQVQNYIPRDFHSGYSIGASYSMYKYGNSVRLFTPYNPTVYEVTGDVLDTVCSIKYADFEFPPLTFLNEIKNKPSFFTEMENSGYVSYYDISETPSALFSTFIVDNKKHMGLYDKKTKQSYAYDSDLMIKKLNIPIDGIIGASADSFIGRATIDDSKNPTLYVFSLE